MGVDGLNRDTASQVTLSSSHLVEFWSEGVCIDETRSTRVLKNGDRISGRIGDRQIWFTITIEITDDHTEWTHPRWEVNFVGK